MFIHSNSLPLRVLPLIQEGELFTLFLKTEEFQNISRIKIYRTAIIQKLFFYRVAGETYAELFENLLVYLA